MHILNHSKFIFDPQPLTTYRKIFKSTALIGGTQVITILVGIIRTKVLAILLGPTGVGLVGLYQATTDLIGIAVGFGIPRSGVRQIAVANGTEDEEKIALSSITLRRLTLGTGLLGMLVILLFCNPLSKITFGNYQYGWGIAIVSLVVLFNGIATGQMALLQGMRKLKDMAKCQILGALFGTIMSVLIVYAWGERAIVWFLVAISAFGVLTTWWYSRKLPIKTSQISTRHMIVEARVLVKTGFAFMVSGLVNTGVLYLTRVLVARELEMSAVGLYSAAITLSSIYVNIILQAMTSDYYPRLAAVAHDNKAVNRMVNEQTEMGLLMAIPGILAMITMAPWILNLFYSQEFSSATNVIRWLLLGVSLQVVSWPMGVILPAKGLSRMMIVAELLKGFVQVISLIVCIDAWGLEGTGISFVITWVVYTLLILLITYKNTGFCWSSKSQLIIGTACIVVTITFLSVLLFPLITGMIVGLVVTAIIFTVSLLILKKMLGFRLFKN